MQPPSVGLKTIHWWLIHEWFMHASWRIHAWFMKDSWRIHEGFTKDDLWMIESWPIQEGCMIHEDAAIMNDGLLHDGSSFMNEAWLIHVRFAIDPWVVHVRFKDASRMIRNTPVAKRCLHTNPLVWQHATAKCWSQDDSLIIDSWMIHEWCREKSWKIMG